MTAKIQTPPAEMIALKIVITHLLDAVSQLAGRQWFDDAKVSCLAAVERAESISSIALDEPAMRQQAADVISQLFDGGIDTAEGDATAG